ncbi:MAG: hypothetical protein BM562_06845 [Alphaproteobacteria bacterium MedPE-SWcel]|nr:MAG: hypothetical protein BM562_06845 [Alphaproteobacteria bacterium MedPE-SWcel]
MSHFLPFVAMSFALGVSMAAAQSVLQWKDDLKPAPSTMSVVQPSQLTTGDIFVGLAMQEEVPSEADLGNFHIGPVPRRALADGKGQSVCVSLLSVDGRYVGDVVYPVKQGEMAPYHVTYSSEYKDKVADLFGAGNIRSFATLGGNCERVQDGMLVATGFTDDPHYFVATLGFANAVVDLWLEPVEPDGREEIPLERCRRSWAVDGGLDCLFDVSTASGGDYELKIEIEFSGQDKIYHSVTTRLP